MWYDARHVEASAAAALAVLRAAPSTHATDVAVALSAARVHSATTSTENGSIGGVAVVEVSDAAPTARYELSRLSAKLLGEVVSGLAAAEKTVATIGHRAPSRFDVEFPRVVAAWAFAVDAAELGAAARTAEGAVVLPVVTRAEDDAALVFSPNRPPCANDASSCEARRLTRGAMGLNAFDHAREYRSRECVLCVRVRVANVWLHAFTRHERASRCAQPYRSLIGPGEYGAHAMIERGAPPDATATATDADATDDAFYGISDPFVLHTSARLDVDIDRARFVQRGVDFRSTPPDLLRATVARAKARADRLDTDERVSSWLEAESTATQVARHIWASSFATSLQAYVRAAQRSAARHDDARAALVRVVAAAFVPRVVAPHLARAAAPRAKRTRIQHLLRRVLCDDDARAHTLAPLVAHNDTCDLVAVALCSFFARNGHVESAALALRVTFLGAGARGRVAAIAEACPTVVALALRRFVWVSCCSAATRGAAELDADAELGALVEERAFRQGGWASAESAAAAAWPTSAVFVEAVERETRLSFSTSSFQEQHQHQHQRDPRLVRMPLHWFDLDDARAGLKSLNRTIVLCAACPAIKCPVVRARDRSSARACATARVTAGDMQLDAFTGELVCVKRRAATRHARGERAALLEAEMNARENDARQSLSASDSDDTIDAAADDFDNGLGLGARDEGGGGGRGLSREVERQHRRVTKHSACVPFVLHGRLLEFAGELVGLCWQCGAATTVDAFSTRRNGLTCGSCDANAAEQARREMQQTCARCGERAEKNAALTVAAFQLPPPRPRFGEIVFCSSCARHASRALRKLKVRGAPWVNWRLLVEAM